MSEYDAAADDWESEAKAKQLPEEWIKTMAETDGFTEEQKKVFVQNLDGPVDFKRKREAAIDLGRRYGEDEANRRRETGYDREQRIARAKMYGAWEFDGKPAGRGKAYRKEFGVYEPVELIGSLERPMPTFPLFDSKKEKAK